VANGDRANATRGRLASHWLAQLYILHYVLDLWAERGEKRPLARGSTKVIHVALRRMTSVNGFLRARRLKQTLRGQICGSEWKVAVIVGIRKKTRTNCLGRFRRPTTKCVEGSGKPETEDILTSLGLLNLRPIPRTRASFRGSSGAKDAPRERMGAKAAKDIKGRNCSADGNGMKPIPLQGKWLRTKSSVDNAAYPCYRINSKSRDTSTLCCYGHLWAKDRSSAGVNVDRSTWAQTDLSELNLLCGFLPQGSVSFHPWPEANAFWGRQIPSVMARWRENAASPGDRAGGATAKRGITTPGDD